MQGVWMGLNFDAPPGKYQRIKLTLEENSGGDISVLVCAPFRWGSM